MRPRLQSSACARPLSFTVRGRNEARLCNESEQGDEPTQRPFTRDCWSARGPCARSWVISSAAAAFVASWWTQYLVRVPSATPAESLAAWAVRLGAAAEVIPVALVITKLARIPRVRTWKNYLLVAIGTVASLPGLLIVFAVLTRA